MTNTRRSLVVALAVIAIVGVTVWRCRAGGPTPAQPGSTNHAHGSARASDPITGAPRWFGQTGVGGRRIAGLVLAASGAPIRGASVRIGSTLTMSGLRAVPSVTTDESGRFDFGVQPAAMYVVVAGLPRLTGAIEHVDLRDSTETPPSDQLRLVLHACDASIHGTIRDTAGGVIPGALVARIGDEGITTSAGAEADDTGTYELCVPAGGASVMVSADGYAAMSEHVHVYGRTRRDFALMPGATVVGRVLRADNRSAIAGAILELHSSDPENHGPRLSTSSDADGRFQFDGVAPGRHAITAIAERLSTARPVDVIAEIGKTSEEIVCELTHTLTISGKVIERGSKTPVPAATVSMLSRAPGVYMARMAPPHAITQADGSFVVDHVFAGEYQPWVREYMDREEPPASKVIVESTDVSGLVLEVTAGATISGRVLHNGKPIDGAWVRITGGHSGTTSNFDGGYTLRGVQAGTFKVYAESHRVGAFTQGPSVTVAKGEHKTNVDVELDLSGSITGVVVDQNDAAIAGVFLSFSLLRGRDFGSATTADDGSFTVRTLSGGGDYLYEVRERDGSALTFPPVTGKRHPPIAVRDGQTQVTGVRIKVRVERLSIAGHITDADGKPIPDVTIRAVANDQRRWYRLPIATSTEGGAFTIRDVPPGKYTLYAKAPRGDASEENVAAGRADVALRLAALGGIDGTLEGFTDRTQVIAYRAEDHERRYGAPYTAPHPAVVIGNTFQLRNLSAGRYRLTATSSADSTSITVLVPPGATTKVALRRAEVGVIAGIVLDEKARTPLPGLQCMSAGVDDDQMWGGRKPSVTEVNGTFRLERTPVGVSTVYCHGDAITAYGRDVAVTAGQVTRVDLVARSNNAGKRRHAGLTLETQLSEVMVKSVEPGGPAARAGIAVGDVLLEIDGMPNTEGESAIYMIEYRAADKPVKLTLERADKELVVTLTLAPAP